MTDTITKDDILGVILAGGQGRRMSAEGDKPLTLLGDKSLLALVLERATPQTRATIINANHKDSRYAAFGLPVVPDSLQGFQGPLAGVLTAMDWAALNMPCRFVASFAADAPFIPRDLVARLAEAITEGADMAYAHSFKRKHPIFCLWPMAIRADLRDQLVNNSVRKIDLFTASYKTAEVSFDGIPDPFFNINTPEDIAEAERLLGNR